MSPDPFIRAEYLQYKENDRALENKRWNLFEGK